MMNQLLANPMVLVAIGVAVGWFMWGRKPVDPTQPQVAQTSQPSNIVPVYVDIQPTVVTTRKDNTNGSV